MEYGKMSDMIYKPSRATISNARVKDAERFRKQVQRDTKAFWESEASELIWFEEWKQYHDASKAPFHKFFVGGKTNISFNCLDRNLNIGNRNKVAYIWESEQGETRTMSYFELTQEVIKFSNVLKSLGVKKGDRVTIYMGRVLELPIAMLACARIGAVHSVVYGGFSSEALAERIEDSESKVIITCDGSYQRGKHIDLKNITDVALEKASCAEKVIVYKRTGEQVEMISGRDYWWHELIAGEIAEGQCEAEHMDSEDSLFILYTSGTTGKPKAIQHVHGGYQVGAYTSLKYVFDIQDNDRYWCAADPGWITGHSYIVYGPLLCGATSIIYEGAPNYPNPDRWWSIIERYGVNILYTAPTAIRSLMRCGDFWVEKHDLSSLRLLGSVGEPINPEAWRWYYETIGGSKCPIMDTWWQTETGMFMITPLPTSDLKPGSGTKPFPGLEMEILDDDGNEVGIGEEGRLVITTPWPSMIRTIFKDPERYVNQYWSQYESKYLTGDSARKDEDGYYWIIGRLDDVIKVSGYRLGTAEIESALVSHNAVAEAAAVGLPHEIKGNAIHTFVILKEGIEESEVLANNLIQQVRSQVGPIAKPETVTFVDKLPKTRSGKIMRRVLKAQLLGTDPGNLSTLED
ncbi:MAG: acetate--CoA ligase [Candidatus Kapaibacteriales bacterium]